LEGQIVLAKEKKLAGVRSGELYKSPMAAVYQGRQTRVQAQSVNWLWISKGMYESMRVMISIGRGISRSGW
jgi:hypothetical protein